MQPIAGIDEQPGLVRVWSPSFPVSLRASMQPHYRGRLDPTSRIEATGVWRCTRTPEGAASIHMTVGAGSITARAWGPGAAWALDSLPELFGAGDEPVDIDPRGYRVLEAALKRFPELRIGRTKNVWEALAPAILEQRVTGKEARASWASISSKYGEPAPGPAPHGMRVPPSAAEVARIPSWEWHKAGVDGSRSSSLLRAAALADRFESVDSATTDRRLRSLPGIGVWTSAEVRQRSHGDPDAISVGDYHLAGFVGWALTGADVDDDGMIELLAPWQGQRHRVVTLLYLGAGPRARIAPRATITDHRRH